jgi:hypothetical protein
MVKGFDQIKSSMLWAGLCADRILWWLSVSGDDSRTAVNVAVGGKTVRRPHRRLLDTGAGLTSSGILTSIPLVIAAIGVRRDRDICVWSRFGSFSRKVKV